MNNSNFEFEFLSEFDPSTIEVANRNHGGKWATIFREWLNTESKAIKLTMKNADDRKLCLVAVRNFVKKNSLDWTIYPEKSTNNVYVVRA